MFCYTQTHRHFIIIYISSSHIHHHHYHRYNRCHHHHDKTFRSEEAVHQTAAVLSQLVAVTGGRKVVVFFHHHRCKNHDYHHDYLRHHLPHNLNYNHDHQVVGRSSNQLSSGANIQQLSCSTGALQVEIPSMSPLISSSPSSSSPKSFVIIRQHYCHPLCHHHQNQHQ